MPASPRRVGTESSKTRDVLLDCVEKLMLEQGYASVTYRALAAKAGVTPSLVQYYFPSLDDLFLASVRRYSDHNRSALEALLKRHADNPLRAIWEYSWDEASGSMLTEIMALSNHRKSIRSEIAELTEAFRRLQIEALAARYGQATRLPGELSLAAAALLVSGIPKVMNLEKQVGVDTAHADAISAVERQLDSLGAAASPPKRKPRATRDPNGRKETEC